MKRKKRYMSKRTGDNDSCRWLDEENEAHDLSEKGLRHETISCYNRQKG